MWGHWFRTWVGVTSLLAAVLLAGLGSHAQQMELKADHRWIGVASSLDLDTATGIAQLFNGARVASAQNGWYAVLLGPARVETIEEFRKHYNGWPALPPDAYATRGSRLVETLWLDVGEPVVAANFDDGQRAKLESRGYTVSIRTIGNKVEFSGWQGFGKLYQTEITIDETYSRFGRNAFLVWLDKSQRFPQLVITTFTGGAHCCAEVKILSEVSPGKFAFVDAGVFDGERGYTFEDIDGDDVAEMISYDNSFLYTFDCYACSFTPIRISRFAQGKVQDVTAEPRYTRKLVQHVAGYEFIARHNPELLKSNGYLAGWLASKTLIGQAGEAWRTVVDADTPDNGFEYLICSNGETSCPDAMKVKVPFLISLANHLRKQGYYLPAAVNAALDATMSGGSQVDSTPKQQNAVEPPPQQEAVGQSSGTGFFVGPGKIVTNEHVIRGCAAVEFTLNGRTERATIEGSDSTNDLALLTTSATPHSMAKLRPGLRLGENISAFGFPLAGILATSGNFTRGSVTATAGISDDSRFFQISAPVQPGNSGGPLLDESANVVGVVSAKMDAIKVAEVTQDLPQNVNFAIKGSILMSFLESRNVQYSLASATPALPPADIAEMAQGFSVQLICNPAP